MSEENKSSEELTIKAPSSNQPQLEKTVKHIKQFIGEPAILNVYINEMDADLVCLEINESSLLDVMNLLRNHPELQFDYLRNLSGVDQESHLEVVYHLTSFQLNQDLCIKVKTDREQPSIQSVTSVWPTANWNEREVYDLLGIQFQNHPDLRRIMMPDDWVGYPLRKDYEPIDPEV